MKHLMLVLLACAIFSAGAQDMPQKADDNEVIQIGEKKITRGQLRRSIKRASESRTGGFVRKENSAKGRFVLVNSQNVVPSADLDSAVKTIDRQANILTQIVSVENVGCENIKDAIIKANGVLGVAVIEDANLPALLTAPEDGWALVNVAKLKQGSPSAVKLAARVRREVLRAFGFISGGAYAGRGDYVMTCVTRPEELDSIIREEYGLTTLKMLPITLPVYGIKPWHRTTYLKACEEGWAPQPTNEFQKAIWEKVHEIPSKPLKITYDEKRDKGK